MTLIWLDSFCYFYSEHLFLPTFKCSHLKTRSRLGLFTTYCAKRKCVFWFSLNCVKTLATSLTTDYDIVNLVIMTWWHSGRAYNCTIGAVEMEILQIPGQEDSWQCRYILVWLVTCSKTGKVDWPNLYWTLHSHCFRSWCHCTLESQRLPLIGWYREITSTTKNNSYKNGPSCNKQRCCDNKERRH